VLAEVIPRAQRRDQRLLVVVLLAHDPFEVVQVECEGIGHDHVETVQLRFEVVIERGRADPDRGGHVGPLGVLVALAPEMLDRAGDDLVALAAGRRAWAPSPLVCPVVAPRLRHDASR
jgi:hypothetical protein